MPRPKREAADDKGLCRCFVMDAGRSRRRVVGGQLPPDATSPAALPPRLVRVLPTRVRRTYRGGRLLDEIEGRAVPVDSDQPESWIASTTRALNYGLSPLPDEGLTRLVAGACGEITLPALLASSPEYYLGSAHVTSRGTQLGFLAKLLDAAVRLHVQAHPTAAFARKHLASPYGKLEVYYVLAVRPGCAGEIRLGFQRSPGREEWGRIIADQDIPAMDRCFEAIAVHPGEAWIVPGGMPHAIGDGILMVEIMEPSDWVVGCEFERAGVVVPPSGRFMNRDLEFCLQIFDYTARSPAEVRQLCQLAPKTVSSGAGWSLDRLVGANRTSCFAVDRIEASRACVIPGRGQAQVVIQTRGQGELRSEGETVALARGQCCLVAAAAPRVEFCPGGDSAEWLLCSPS